MIAALFLATVIAAAPPDSAAHADSAVRPPAPQEGWLGVDKTKHFALSAFVQSFAFGTIQALGGTRFTSEIGATAITAAVSLGREVKGGRAGTGFSVRDLAWDAAGAAAAMIFLTRTIPTDR